MSQASSPFSKQQLLPQEETLEVVKQKGELFIGIPKENQYQEKRVCLTPDAVNAITANGHRVLLESGAGEGANFSDIDYTNAGAEITRDTKKVFSCPIILKVEPPTLAEIELLNPQAIIISALQIKTQSKKYFEQLAQKRVTAIAFEYIRDEDGKFPAVRSLSEIAGITSILIAAELMATTNQGNGDVNDMFNALQNTNTSVPIRNIPTNSNHIITDQQVKANYVPEKESVKRFVEDSNYDREVEEQPRSVSWLEKFHVPLLIVVIGVIVQMKQVNDSLFKIFPSLFSKEGVIQTNGILLKAVLGSGLFMLSQQVLEDML